MAEKSDKIEKANKVLEDFKKMILDAKYSPNMGEFTEQSLMIHPIHSTLFSCFQTRYSWNDISRSATTTSKTRLLYSSMA